MHRGKLKKLTDKYLSPVSDKSSTVDEDPAQGNLSGAGWNASAMCLYQPADFPQDMIGWPAEGMLYEIPK
jgi:hypothetical protein